MEIKFKIGDIVMLKSGGPKMTITKIVMNINLGGPSQPTGNLRVSWFDGTDNKHSEYHQDALESAS